MTATLTPRTARTNLIKLGVIPLLVVVLVATLWYGSRPLPSSTPEGVAALSTRSRKARQPAAQKTKPDWPKFDLNEVIAVSPFGPRTPFGAPTPTESESTESTAIDSVPPPKGDQQRTLTAADGELQAIYQTSSGAVAVVNSRIVRPGDLLAEGVRVVEITNDSVVVESE